MGFLTAATVAGTSEEMLSSFLGVSDSDEKPETKYDHMVTTKTIWTAVLS